MPAITPSGGKPCAGDQPRPGRWSRPENDRICENVVAPTMMNRIMPEMAAVPRSACIRFSQRERSGRRAPAATVASAPSAADSVGVAQPADIAPTTMTKIEHQRHHVLEERPQAPPAVVLLECRRWRARASGRASRARRCRRRRSPPAAARARCRRSAACEIEMPDRLPSSTVSAEGGISMSTRADRHDRPGRHGRVIAAREHHRQHQAAQHGGGGDGGAGDRREHRAGDHRDHRQPPGHAADQALDRRRSPSPRGRCGTAPRPSG